LRARTNSPEIDAAADRANLIEWKRELEKHRADYERFLRSEAEILKYSLSDYDE
jgi:hypothetical protein